MILLDANGESCDADVSDSEEVVDQAEARSGNFTFVGAEIKTGKSSIRSKQKAKKVSILLLCTLRKKKVDKKELLIKIVLRSPNVSKDKSSKFLTFSQK